MKILVSRCLLGEPCRYDGASKPHPAIQSLAERHTLVPVCPEVDGGLSTPRIPAERKGDSVINQSGVDVTREYTLGARIALDTALQEGVDFAILKARSPSCGHGEIYDGSFSRTLISGDGVTAELLLSHGIPVYTEESFPKNL
ncbi:MAG: DUF523 domain-containing protein [Clostridia bacterium]|nr:DUF523 domain-containing protein [Clostridia bacterium]